MTPEKRTNLLQAIRVDCATALGWVETSTSDFATIPPSSVWSLPGTTLMMTRVFDYTGDRNAAASLVESVLPRERVVFVSTLLGVKVDSVRSFGHAAIMRVLCASPFEIARAFLVVRKKWTEEYEALRQEGL